MDNFFTLLVRGIVSGNGIVEIVTSVNKLGLHFCILVILYCSLIVSSVKNIVIIKNAKNTSPPKKREDARISKV